MDLLCCHRFERRGVRVAYAGSKTTPRDDSVDEGRSAGPKRGTKRGTTTRFL